MSWRSRSPSSATRSLSDQMTSRNLQFEPPSSGSWTFTILICFVGGGNVATSTASIDISRNLRLNRSRPKFQHTSDANRHTIFNIRRNVPPTRAHYNYQMSDLRKLVSELHQLVEAADNLSSVQRRCTELIEENRRLKRRDKRVRESLLEIKRWKALNPAAETLFADLVRLNEIVEGALADDV